MARFPENEPNTDAHHVSRPRLVLSFIFNFLLNLTLHFHLESLFPCLTYFSACFFSLSFHFPLSLSRRCSRAWTWTDHRMHAYRSGAETFPPSLCLCFYDYVNVCICACDAVFSVTLSGSSVSYTLASLLLSPLLLLLL